MKVRGALFNSLMLTLKRIATASKEHFCLYKITDTFRLKKQYFDPL
jgi:hypothetical protein